MEQERKRPKQDIKEQTKAYTDLEVPIIRYQPVVLEEGYQVEYCCCGKPKTVCSIGPFHWETRKRKRQI